MIHAIKRVRLATGFKSLGIGLLAGDREAPKGIFPPITHNFHRYAPATGVTGAASEAGASIFFAGIRASTMTATASTI